MRCNIKIEKINLAAGWSLHKKTWGERANIRHNRKKFTADIRTKKMMTDKLIKNH